MAWQSAEQKHQIPPFVGGNVKGGSLAQGQAALLRAGGCAAHEGKPQREQAGPLARDGASS